MECDLSPKYCLIMLFNMIAQAPALAKEKGSAGPNLFATGDSLDAAVVNFTVNREQVVP